MPVGILRETGGENVASGEVEQAIYEHDAVAVATPRCVESTYCGLDTRCYLRCRDLAHGHGLWCGLRAQSTNDSRGQMLGCNVSVGDNPVALSARSLRAFIAHEACGPQVRAVETGHPPGEALVPDR